MSVGELGFRNALNILQGKYSGNFKGSSAVGHNTSINSSSATETSGSHYSGLTIFVVPGYHWYRADVCYRSLSRCSAFIAKFKLLELRKFLFHTQVWIDFDSPKRNMTNQRRIRSQSNIYDRAFLRKYLTAKCRKLLQKKPHMFDWLLVRLLLSALKMLLWEKDYSVINYMPIRLWFGG